MEKKINGKNKMQRKKTLDHKMASKASRTIGSWPFVIGQTVFIIFWITMNVFGFMRGWDVYPFVFLNLMLSIMATYAAPIILMSQNRESERDRIRITNDLATDRRVEREVMEIKKLLKRIERKISE